MPLPREENQCRLFLDGFTQREAKERAEQEAAGLEGSARGLTWLLPSGEVSANFSGFWSLHRHKQLISKIQCYDF